MLTSGRLDPHLYSLYLHRDLEPEAGGHVLGFSNFRLLSHHDPQVRRRNTRERREYW